MRKSLWQKRYENLVNQYEQDLGDIRSLVETLGKQKIEQDKKITDLEDQLYKYKFNAEQDAVIIQEIEDGNNILVSSLNDLEDEYVDLKSRNIELLVMVERLSRHASQDAANGTHSATTEHSRIVKAADPIGDNLAKKDSLASMQASIRQLRSYKLPIDSE